MARDAHRPGRSRQTFTKQLQEAYLEHLRNGMRRGAAAIELELPRRLVLDHIRDHEDFEAEVLDAEDEATEHVEEALYQAAISGNPTACKMWLEWKRGGKAPKRPGTGAFDDNTFEAELAALNRTAGT